MLLETARRPCGGGHRALAAVAVPCPYQLPPYSHAPRLVAVDSKDRRDGKPLEYLGWGLGSTRGTSATHQGALVGLGPTLGRPDSAGQALALKARGPSLRRAHSPASCQRFCAHP